MALERELKFAIGEDVALPGLDDAAAGLHVTTRDIIDIDAVYYDTEDLLLARNHVGVRRRIGRAWTFKGPSRIDAGAVVREEHEWPDSTAIPGPLAARLEDRFGPVDLVPVVSIHTRRHRLDVSDDSGTQVAEIDDDVVDVRDGENSVDRFREIEIELAVGTAADRVAPLISRLEAAGAVGHTTGKLTRALRAVGRLPR